MAIDLASCGVAEPESILLHCAATAGVWLRAASDGRVLDQACVDFDDLGDGGQGEDGGDPFDPLWTLADLPPLLAGVQLTTTIDEEVRVDVAVYVPWSASDGCVPPDRLPDGAPAPELVVSGGSLPDRLSESPSGLPITLACSAPPLPADEWAECEDRCFDEEDLCFDEAGVDPCFDAFFDCTSPCEDLKCETMCEEALDACLGLTPEGTCFLESKPCRDECAENPLCKADCDGENLDCLDRVCPAVFDECAEGCGAGDECVNVAVGL
jgi:hypothetical protein